MKGDLTEQKRSKLGGLPRGIWALGLVSLFMDISSEMIHGLLPVFLTSVLGASAEMVGLIEGIGEATASICKLFSGWLSDRIGKRKVLAVLGYGLAAISKPLFAVAPSASLVLRPASLTASARAYAMPRAMRLSATSYLKASAAQPTGCGRR